MAESEEFTGDELEFEYEDDDNSFADFEYDDEDDDEDEVEEIDGHISDEEGLVRNSDTLDSEHGSNIIKVLSKANIGALPGEDKNKYTTVKYKPWTMEEYISVHYVSKCRKLESMKLPNLDFDDLLILLNSKNWKVDEVINAYYDNPDKLFESCGLPYSSNQGSPSKKNNKFEIIANFQCSICYSDDDVQTETYSLTCNHRYCVSCYSRYVLDALHEGKLITCPECDLTIPHRDVQKFVNAAKPGGGSAINLGSTFRFVEYNNNNNNESVLPTGPGAQTPALDPTKFESLKFAARREIGQNNKKGKSFKWCPAPDCNHLVELLSHVDIDFAEEEDGHATGDSDARSMNLNNVPIVTCPDSHEFCYSCSYENHLPCPCWLVKLWIKKCSDDSETANWIQANTQACPKCDTQIEKNGGCNHMTCKKCAFDFCWICLSSWELHGTQYYKCNRFDVQKATSIQKHQQSKRLSLQRYLFFYKRFAVHETSMRGDKQTLDKVDQKMKIYMNEESQKRNKGADGGGSALSWIDVQFLHDAIKQLTNGRKTLKWTYAFAFYLSKSNFSDIFEQMVDYLNKTVEDLSRIFEEINDKKNKGNSSKLIMKHKQDIINLSNLVGQRQEKLIECAFSGLNQKLLKLETGQSET